MENSQKKDENNYQKSEKNNNQDMDNNLDNNQVLSVVQNIPKNFISGKTLNLNFISYYKKLKKNTVLISIYFFIVIYSNNIYQEKLFDKSIKFQEKIHKNFSKYPLFFPVFKLISRFGNPFTMQIIYFIIFLFFPLNSSFLILQSVIYPSYFTNLMKNIYRQDRPYWRSEILRQVCSKGYGNPSGHSFCSTCFYLCLYKVIINDWKLFNNLRYEKLFKFIIFIFTLLFVLLIVISRVILGAHSINQILYGSLLGFGTYFILINILSYHKYKPYEFLKHIQKKSVKIIYNLFHFSLLFYATLIYLKAKEKKKEIIKEKIFNGTRCKVIYPYKNFKEDGLFQSLSITAVIGAYLGILFLLKLLKFRNYIINENIINWNKIKNNTKWFYSIPIIIASGLGIILYYFIPGNSPLFIIFCFKSAIPFFLAAFGIHSFGIYYCIYYKIANRDLYKMEMINDVTSKI